MLAIKLLESTGIRNSKWSAVDIVKQDLQSIVRIVNDVFRAFKKLDSSGAATSPDEVNPAQI
jgi:hypothetical protein